MKYITIIVLLFSSNTIFAQTTLTVTDFAEEYFGKIYIADTTEVFSKGWIAIFDKKSGEQIITVVSEELDLRLHDGQALANIAELPYGEQSLIMYEDYNFDGKKDFAIEDGQNSCYHGPSFQIYLANNGRFVFNPDFTKLSQEYCGMFRVEASEKKIYTMTKSGCCWHQYSEFIVENNKPKAVTIIEEDRTNLPYYTYSEELWNGTKMVKSSRKTIDVEEEGVSVILSFRVEKREKEIVLFTMNNRTLFYAVLDKNGSVEFSYPMETAYDNSDFRLDTTKNTLTFQNKDATYKVYSNENSVGIDVVVNGKTYNWIGNLSTKKGKLHDLLLTKPDNVVIR